LRDVPVEAVSASFLYVRTGREVVHDTDLTSEQDLTALLTGQPVAQPLTLL
jgi:hypothetical protein